ATRGRVRQTARHATRTAVLGGGLEVGLAPVGGVAVAIALAFEANHRADARAARAARAVLGARARLTGEALGAIAAATAVDIGFGAVLHLVGAAGHGTNSGRAHPARAVTVPRTNHPGSAGAAASSAIDVGLVVVSRLVGAVARVHAGLRGPVGEL